MFKKLNLRAIILMAIISLAVFIAFSVVITATRTLPVPIYNIVDLEFAWTADRANQIMQTWGLAVVAQELLITYLDFGYLIGYGAMAFWLLVLGTRIVSKNERLVKAGTIFAWLSIVSPIMDVIENVNLVSMMASFPGFLDTASTLAASVCASIKFGVLFLSIGVFAVEILFALITRRR
ncbi:MAG: hypothetical protein JW839_08790 [Candidatus Lokiarchaeota archaeon]|nr:hypothetical protein [Candidatus Lokiarchaeota archaeon]